MATNLLEAYKKRIAISESVYSKNHSGERMSNHKKITVAKVLENTNKFLNEAFSSSMGTQRSDMGLFKKFCLNLTTVALPNLIAHDLVLVHPMSSMSGYITYVKYIRSTKKGDQDGTQVFNSPFALGKADADYTSSRVVEPVTTFTSGKTKLAWGPVALDENDAPIIKFLDANGDELTATDVSVAEDGTVTATIAEGTVAKIAYVYNNIIIPQNDIPSIKATMDSIPLIAKARRIAVYYSQIAAFQAKTDYGFDLGDQLAEQAVGQLSYEIDTEVVKLLDDTAKASATKYNTPALEFDRTLPVGVSKAEHYEGFSEVVEIAKQIVYDRTQKFAPNYIIIASNILPILTFVKGFTAAPAGVVNGPYLAGTLNGMKVFVSPALEEGRFLVGVNGNDMMSSVAVYAPYMAIVPTQLLQYADGGTSQGWSTLYDLKVLNDALIVEGKITGDTLSAIYGNTESPVITQAKS